MKKTLSALLIAVLLLAGCSASTGYVADDKAQSVGSNAGDMSMEIAPMEPGTSMDNGYYDKGDYDYGWSGEESDSVSPEAPSAAPTTGTTSGEMVLDKIIYTADLTLETQEFDKISGELSALVASYGGYFENRQINQGGSYRSLYCVIRIPADRYAEFLAQAGEVAHMTACNERSTNVSEAYYDLESRLATQRIKLERLQELLAQAKDVYDITTILSEISNTEWQIENYTRQLRGYDNQIAYSTVNLSLREVYRLTEEDPAPMTFGDRVSNAFGTGIRTCVNNLESFVLYLVMNWLNLIIWAAILIVACIVIRRYRRKLRGEAAVREKKPNDEDKK